MQVLNTIANNRFWNKHGVTTTWVVAGVCLLLALVYVGWISYAQSQVRADNYQPQSVAPLAQPAKKLYRVSDITSANLFGDPTPKPVVTNAPKTTLNLTLRGVLSASDAQLARAIITSGKNKTQVYSVGEKIQGAGASIKEIHAAEVLLNRNGATESLALVQAGKGKKTPIISYVSAGEPVRPNNSFASISSGSQYNRADTSRQFAAANANSNQRSSSQNNTGKPRKVRKPNFSGLDRALKKMGEL